MNHAEELISQLRILGRLEEFGSARASPALPGRRRRGAHPLAPAALVLRAAAQEGGPAAAARQAPGRRAVALDNRQEYRLAEEDVIAWLRQQPLDLSELESRVAAALRAERLAQLNALKRLAAKGKVGAALGWIEDFLASDEPLVVFAGNREVQRLVVERFPDALHILGADSIERREAAVRAFQEKTGRS
jgi:hypothetical protein